VTEKAPPPYTALVLAYVGDAVFELMARLQALSEGELPPGRLQPKVRRWVTAKAQARLYHGLQPFLTQEEQAVLRRGRNAKPASQPKSATVSEYIHATGVESLFGYLYLAGREARLWELFQHCIEFSDKEGTP
jgi:ribonuclease-3 family protein